MQSITSLPTAQANIDHKYVHHGTDATKNKIYLGINSDILAIPRRSSGESQNGSVHGCRLRHAVAMKRAGIRHAKEITDRLQHEMDKPKSESRFKNKGEALRLFRKVARRAIICSHWVSCVLKVQHGYLETQLEQLSDKSKTMEQTLFLKQMELAGTVFNKQNYMPNREICLKRDIQYILTLPPETRTEEDIAKVLSSLQSVKSFTEFPSHVQYGLCRVAWYQKVPPKKVIIRQGHQGVNFYFVISGRGIIKVLRRRTDGTIMNGEKIVFQIERGSSFGDIALLHNVERTATVESYTEMSLLAIGRDDFVKLFLQREMDGVRPEHTTFLKTVNALQHWPVECLSKTTGNCIFHYFKRGKLIVADSNNSDFLYIIKSGSCQVIKQLTPASKQGASTGRRIKGSGGLVINLMADIRNKAKLYSTTKLPPMNSDFTEDRAKQDMKIALKKLAQAKKDEPAVMLDIPGLVLKQLEELQRQLRSEKLNSKSALVGLANSTGSCDGKQRQTATLQIPRELRIDECQESSPCSSATSTVWREKSRSESTLKTFSGIQLKSDNSKENSRKMDKSLINIPKIVVDDCVNTISKKTMVKVTRKWKSIAARNSDDVLKVLSKAREVNKAPNKLISEALGDTPKLSDLPKVDAANLMLSHEGKSQSLNPRGRSKTKADEKVIFVGLGLLRAKDVFGLETLDFDANYSGSDTSVCLVSRGAEVLMLRKKFFLENCNSENLEHLRRVVCPYPKEASMQDNLKVSVNWSSYCDQLIANVLQRIAAKRQLR